jgi:prevent-host-death family protein
MTDSVTIHEAKTHLSKLVARVEAGEQFIVRRGKVPVAMLVRYEPPQRVRAPGAWKGRIWMADDFNEFLPPEFAEYA